uniref:Uncharacterized protein n=1 Tax=Oryza punctata TaxID=4537 RepID=A0A0E0M682_ORYPU
MDEATSGLALGQVGRCDGHGPRRIKGPFVREAGIIASGDVMLPVHTKKSFVTIKKQQQESHDEGSNGRDNAPNGREFPKAALTGEGEDQQLWSHYRRCGRRSGSSHGGCCHWPPRLSTIWIGARQRSQRTLSVVVDSMGLNDSCDDI